jgi:hypothetical protein
MIEVHHFKIRNPKTGNWDVPPCKRTADDIAKLKGELIPDTMEMVFKAMLDSEKRYFPPHVSREHPVKTTIQVHHMKKWNVTSDKWEIPPTKRTAQDIEALGGVVVEDTAEEIDRKDLDEHGRYFPTGAAVQVDRPVPDDKKKRKPK